MATMDVGIAVKEYKNFIGGEWVASRSGATFENRNPADTRDVVGTFPRSNAQDVDEAVKAAQKAFETWRLVPAPKRAEIVFRAGQILEQRKEEYAHDMTREMGKVLMETRGDVQEAIDTAYYMAGEGRRLFGITTPSEMPAKFAMAIRVPVGVIGMIAPWNFPMAIPSWKIFPAIVCGNTCVIKPAEDTPLSTFNLVQALVDAGLPKGVVNIVTGYGPEAGQPLVEHEGTKAISFTGSSEVGKMIGALAAERFKPVSLEMGGKNAIVVLEDANVDLAVEGVLWGAFGTAGQRCTAASRVILHEKVYDEFAQKLTGALKGFKVGSGLDESVKMGPQVNGDRSTRRRSTWRSARVRARRCLRVERRSRPALTSMDTSISRRCLEIAIRRCESRKRRSSVP